MSDTTSHRLQTFDTMLAEGRIIRGSWTGKDSQGRDTACLLASLSPEVAHAKTAGACPAEVMPSWLAHLTPWIDDAGTDAKWGGFVVRFGVCAHRWGALDELAWSKLRWMVCGIIVREAVTHVSATTYPKVVKACERVIALCDAGARNGVVDERERREARGADAAAAAADAERESADRMIDKILTAIEVACEVGS